MKKKIGQSPVPSMAALSLLLSCLTLATLSLFLSGCSMLTGGVATNRENNVGGGGILKGLRPSADPALVQRIKENEKKEAEKQAAQGALVSQTGGAETFQPGLGRNLPKVSTDPISSTLTQTNANGAILAANTQQQSNNAFANPNAQLATYESAYNAVPPPPPGSLAAGLVPPPPAVTLSTQAQTYGGGAESAASFYNNPYFNPYGVPAPPQAASPERRPAGLFGNGNTSRNESQIDVEKTNPKHKASFVPISPTGMEPRSPYKQRDDLRVLWKAALKDSIDASSMAENKHLLADLNRIDVGLPSDSSRGSFNISPRQIEIIFKSSAIDKRAFPEVRKLQTDLAQAYYRYLSAYNKFALTEQTTAARQQEADLSESDSERQRATADLAQAKNDLDSAKDDMHSAEIELAAASSPAAARTVIGRVAGVSPSVESLAQGCAQSGSHAASHGNKIANVFESVFRHSHSSEVVNSVDEQQKLTSKEHNKNKKLSSHPQDNDSENAISADSDLSPAPISKKHTSIASEDTADVQQSASKSSSASNSTISFELKGVDIKPRKSVLTVAVKNGSDEAYELNPDAICISQGNHKLAAAEMRTDFDTTSIQPDHEVKGTITVFGHPWDNRLLVYLSDGNKKIQLKR